MIRVHRSNEPRGLVRARGHRLGDAIAAYEAHGAPSQELSDTLKGYGSRATKKALFKAQFKKCAWCEIRQPFSSSPVEHYRPKDGAWRHLPGQARRVDDGHYWWLTWTWTNLFFACSRCNDQAHKANHFPRVPGTLPAPTPTRPVQVPPATPFFDVSQERPLLLDPADPAVDPLDHVVWQPFDTKLARRLWKWVPRGLTDRGRATIAILRLDEFTDDVSDHLRVAVPPSIEETERHLQNGRKADGVQRWQTLLGDVLAPDSQLSAATWFALERWMPASERAKHGLTDPPRLGQ